MAPVCEMNELWRNASLMTRLRQDRKDHSFTDATIVYGLNVYHVHSMMLQSISPVFARMLTTSTTKRLDLSPDPLDAIQLMLAFLYSGQYDPDKTVRLTMHIRVYTMAEKYAMDTLTQAVTERVKHLISDGLRRDPRIPIPFMKGLRYNYWDDDDLTGAVEMLWYEPGPPCWALRELVMKAAVVRKRQLLLLPRFRELVRGGTEFVVLLMCDGVVYVGD